MNLSVSAGVTSLLAFTALLLSQCVVADPLFTFPLKVRGHEIRAEVANTEATRRQGLMHRERLAENAGMLFIYSEPEAAAMWMKNTRIPLSVAFLDGQGRILNIEDMEPFSEQAHTSKGIASYALEVNRGWFRKRGIRAGERVDGLAKLPAAK